MGALTRLQSAGLHSFELKIHVASSGEYARRISFKQNHVIFFKSFVTFRACLGSIFVK